MFETCDTVLIKGANGDPVRVNASDFEDDQKSDKPTMEKFVAVDDNAPPKPLTDEKPSQMLVSKEGTGAKTVYFVVDAGGAKITGTGIAVDGYTSEADAWAAIMAVTAPPAA